MRYSKSYINRNEGKFDSFCKTVLKNLSRDWGRRNLHRKKREILFSDLPFAPHTKVSYTDRIMCIEFQEFHELGRTVMIKNDTLVNALRMLSPQKRQIILLSYFLGWTDKKIGIQFHTARSTIQATRVRTLQEMREIIEKQWKK